MSDPATDRQLKYIADLGGQPSKGMTKDEASALIEKLLGKDQPSPRQIKRLQNLGVTIPDNLTAKQASQLIDKLDGDQPPTKKQIGFIKLLGDGQAPATKREAAQLCTHLKDTAPATEEQRNMAVSFGQTLPDGSTFRQAELLLDEMKADADETEGRPPTEAQIKKIKKLGGDPAKAKNHWRADEYISDLEDAASDRADAVEELKSRAQEVLEMMYDELSRNLRNHRKPSLSVMMKALEYGDKQGWGEGWEDALGDNEENADEQLNQAVIAVAPQLLKGTRPQPSKKSKKSSGDKGCFPLIVLIVIVACAFWIWRSL